MLAVYMFLDIPNQVCLKWLQWGMHCLNGYLYAMVEPMYSTVRGARQHSPKFGRANIYTDVVLESVYLVY